MIRRALLLLLLWSVAWGQPVLDQSVLETAYARAAFGAELKFLDGLLANRADDFKLYGPDGAPQDLRLERMAFAQLFAASARVKLETRILSCQAKAGEARASVEQVLSFERVDEQSGKLYTQVFRTRSTDRWCRRGGQPVLVESRISQQSCSREAPLPEE